MLRYSFQRKANLQRRVTYVSPVLSDCVCVVVVHDGKESMECVKTYARDHHDTPRGP